MSTPAIRAAMTGKAFRISRFVPFQLTVMSSQLTHRIAQVYGGKFGLSASEWRTIGVLAESGPLTSAHVIVQTTMDKVRVSQTVARLLRAGYITREPDPLDRRRAVLNLTPSGLDIYRAIVPLVQQAEAELMKALSRQERSTFRAALGKMEAHIRRLDAAAQHANSSAL